MKGIQIELIPTHKRKDFAPVTATLLPDLAPHLASVATFAVHQSPAIAGGFAWGYSVSNVETGLGVSQLCRTPENAIDVARRILKTKTEADALAAYERAPKRVRGKA